MKTIYLIGSLRNPEVPKIAAKIRQAGLFVFDDWYAAGPIADDSWQAYEKERGTSYEAALSSWAAQHVFQFDRFHLDRSHIGVLVMPAGKSGHLELGYLAGQGKPTFVLFDKEPDRWDVMYAFQDKVFFKVDDLVMHLTNMIWGSGMD